MKNSFVKGSLLGLASAVDRKLDKLEEFKGLIKFLFIDQMRIKTSKNVKDRCSVFGCDHWIDFSKFEEKQNDVEVSSRSSCEKRSPALVVLSVGGSIVVNEFDQLLKVSFIGRDVEFSLTKLVSGLIL